jgi:hypothetical protein
MSWITLVWSITAGICLALAGLQLLVWFRTRNAWANLLFSIGAVAAAACAVGEQALMHAHTPAQYGKSLQRLTNLGHTHVSNTYWYLSAIPELMQLVALRLEQTQGGILS